MGTSYRKLVAWQKGMELVTAVYRVTACFPKHEQYALTNQLRRAAVSVPSNIAEGQARYSQREFYRFLSNARGSLAEVETQILISENLGYIDSTAAGTLLNHSGEVGRVLNGLISVIRPDVTNQAPKTEKNGP